MSLHISPFTTFHDPYSYLECYEASLIRKVMSDRGHAILFRGQLSLSRIHHGYEIERKFKK